MLYLYYLPVSIILILLYFRAAVKFMIIDTPNHRSSHSEITIRGGGVIFPLIYLLYETLDGFDEKAFLLGLIIISLVSFYDDLKPLSNKVRILGHLIAVSLLFTQVRIFDYPIWVGLGCYLIVIGIINAYNFMDGINGMTGAYSLVCLASLFYINETFSKFIPNESIIIVIIAVLVFTYFNFRKKARCFAGDVGSISMAFILIFFISQLIIITNEIKYAGLMLVYGLDTATTMVFRLIRGENIFQAHRSHFYQFLANNLKLPHLTVSSVYAILQLTINLLLINLALDTMRFLLLVGFTTIIFLYLRFSFEGKQQLFKTSNKI